MTPTCKPLETSCSRTPLPSRYTISSCYQYPCPHVSYVKLLVTLSGPVKTPGPHGKRLVFVSKSPDPPAKVPALLEMPSSCCNPDSCVKLLVPPSKSWFRIQILVPITKPWSLYPNPCPPVKIQVLVINPGPYHKPQKPHPVVSLPSTNCAKKPSCKNLATTCTENLFFCW